MVYIVIGLEEMRKYMKKFFGHLKNVLIHKYWVFHYCCKFGIPVRGLLHDMSKFNPIEFFESVKFYQGDKSPIPEIKKVNTVSYAWQHHKGRNPHHYEYWTDHYDDGSRVCHKIPYKYLMELLADWFAAGKTYALNAGKNFSPKDEYEWWLKKKENPNLAIHPATMEFIDMFMYDAQFFSPDMNWMKDKHNREVMKYRLNKLYNGESLLN